MALDVNIKKLLKDLQNNDDDLRALSAMTLMKLDVIDKNQRDEIITHLIRATKDKNLAVRFFARKALDKLRKQSQEEQILEPQKISLDKLLESDNYEDKIKAIMQISKENKAEYKPILMRMLQNETHDFVKASLISSLKKFLTKDEAQILSQFLQDPDNRVRANTIEAIEYLKLESAIPSLFAALEDSDNRIRSVAAKALASFGEEKVFEILSKMLYSNEEWLKHSAIYALSHIYSSASIQMLIETVKSANNSLDTKIRAVIALANFKDLTSYNFLKTASQNMEEPIKSTAFRALKLYEEKFGNVPPTTTIVKQIQEKKSEKTKTQTKSQEEPSRDITTAVKNFFRKGKEEAVELSQKAAIQFAYADYKKELDEICKEAGRIAFDMYQSGDLKIPELLTYGHEILRINYLIQKYADELEQNKKDNEGFFAQIKALLFPNKETNSKKQVYERYIQKREDLFQKLGEAVLKDFSQKNIHSQLLESCYNSYNRIKNKIERETQGK